MADEQRFQVQEKRLRVLMERDRNNLLKKNREYDQSWLRRGGVGSFMMLARKMDRIEPACEKHNYDIFQAIKEDCREEGILDDIRDLRNYLYLVEEEMMHRGVVPDVLGPEEAVVMGGDGGSESVGKVSTHSIGSGKVTNPRRMVGKDRNHPFGYDPDLDNPPEVA